MSFVYRLNKSSGNIESWKGPLLVLGQNSEIINHEHENRESIIAKIIIVNFKISDHA
jgi:hypothetical protein